MAAIERGAGADDAVVKGWLARALTAPRGPKWVCDNCQKSHGDWTPVCDSCGGFDTLSWRRADENVSDLPAGTEMLPLIVGQIAKGEPDVEDAVLSVPEPADEVTEVVGNGTKPADPESSETANADAPPADYVEEDETEIAREPSSKKDAT